MTPKVKISEFVIKRLDNVKTQCSGELFGIMCNQTMAVLGFNLESNEGSLNYNKIQNNFPTEIDLCGLIKFGLCSDAEAHLSEILQDIDITDNPILLNCEIGTSEGLKASLFKHGQLESIKYEIITEEDLYKEFFFVRLQCDLDVLVEQNEKSISENMFALRKKLASGNVAFIPAKTNITLSGNQAVGVDPETKMGQLLEITNRSVEDEDFPAKTKKKNVKNLTDFEIMDVNMILKRSKDSQDEKLQRDACRVVLDSKNLSNKIQIPLQIDALSMLKMDTKIVLFYDILVESVCRTLRLMEHNLLDQLQNLETMNAPKTVHFKPLDFGHFFTCVFPYNISDNDEYLYEKRKDLHNLFGLPKNRPHFRTGNQFNFKKAGCKLLYNPHVGLKQLVKDGKQSLVQGKYSYHHYMQDNFNDNGWGCAYRSLQTLCSWFKYQGYSDSEIPSHKDIQKYLVNAGDKPSTFLGSQQWIGSTEVSMCLNEFMKIDSKIMHVSSGGELASKGSELSYHFESQGTPIMIGGGVLAHTILGVDFNRTTGELKFLILDPHYTGEDDLSIVQSKGWCGWKGTDFWDKKSYYNLCMPQKPYMF